jgi:integrase
MTRMHASIRRWLLQKHILPALRAKRLSAIKPTDIEALLLGKLEEGLSAQSVNHLRATLSTMFKQAMRQGLRDDNPVATVPKAKGSQAERGILTREEVDRLLSEEDIETVWQGDMVAYTANLLAATAGLRLGEVLALRAQDVQADHLIVAHSWNALQGLKGTKTGRTRVVPIPEKTRDYLARLCAPTRAFLFGEPWPVEGDKIRQALYRALGRIGITDQERRRRHLCFHSWRHWYNTMLRGQVSDAKLRLLTGHQTQAMCDNYTHYGAEDFGDVRQALATLWGDQKQEGQP